MSSVPESALHIESALREDELSDSEQYLYDQFARAFLECNSIKYSALMIGFNIFIAHEWGQKIYDHGFTHRRMAYLLNAAVGDEERQNKLNKSFRVVSQNVHNPDPKIALTAAVQMHKMHDSHLENIRLGYGDKDKSNGGVMVIPSGPETLDGWGAACEASQAAMQLEIDKDNAEKSD